MSFMEAASPMLFHNDPAQYWYFYGHRFNLYSKTRPYAGFNMLLDMGEKLKSKNYFVYTSNVDGQFQKAGFPEDRIVECHGSIGHCQCRRCFSIVPAPFKEIPIDYEKCVATEIPHCKQCKSILRPNIMMFNDFEWIGERTKEQKERYFEFLDKNT
eukprot:TRINITY_DN2380_c0_g10_i1.p3 TRINITY_DN2380_c0_g10~~TRINITY_DN2380_c0_g10_i1.p3  ORF type:complete len:156 (+),score=21.70 TRINITY_DN2380_c0_g10_i1:951-1418(+)